MTIWELSTWEEVTELAILNRTCIRPGQEDYRRAQEDFQRGNVRYLGFSANEVRGYIRLVTLGINGNSAFVDYIAPAIDNWIREEDMYRCLEEAAGFIRQYEPSHFYVLGNTKQQNFFKDRKVDTIDLKNEKRSLP